MDLLQVRLCPKAEAGFSHEVRELPTVLVAMRATARIRIRCIPWSASVEDVVADNAGSRVDDNAECGSPDWRIV